MNRIQLLIVAGLCAAVLLAVGCTEEYSDEVPFPPSQGTVFGSWNFVGFVDAKTEVVREPMPKTMTGRYSLVFRSRENRATNDEATSYSYTVGGSSSSDHIDGVYAVDYSTATVKIEVKKREQTAEIFDGSLYIECLNASEFFVVLETELRLYYNHKTEYLLFKREGIEQQNHPPIDWENYNDVYAVYSNYATGDCSQAGPTGKIIKVEGYILQPGGNLREIDPSHFYLAGYPNQIFFFDAINIWAATPEVAEQLRIKFENSNLGKKCYITGELNIGDLPINGACRTIPIIWITDADNVIFE